MTICEAIKKCEYGLRFSDEECDELQTMLEELKELRQFKYDSEDGLRNAIYEAETSIYNKALEDYNRLISEECKLMLIKINPYASHLKDYNDKILERLKAGGNS